MTNNSKDRHPVPITDATFDGFVADNPVVLVDFWAEWCHPCRMLAPAIDALARDIQGIAVGKLNVDENRDTAIKYGIMSIPTLLYFKKGKLVDKTIGVVSKDTIETKLLNLL
jgi:thioredoxin 1